MQTLAFQDAGQSDDSWDLLEDEDLLLSFTPGTRSPAAASPALGPLPTEEEADDAARLLQHTLREYSAHRASGPLTFPIRAVSGSEGSIQELEDYTESAARLVAAARANASSSRRALVSQAVHLYTENEGVQRVVRALACDSAVWRAVSNNPEVRRLINGPRLLAPAPHDESPHQPNSSPSEDRVSPAPGVNPPLALRLHHVLQQMLQRLTDFKASLLGTLARVLGLSRPEDESHDHEDDTNKHLLPGIVMMVVLVLGIIVLKRPILV